VRGSSRGVMGQVSQEELGVRDGHRAQLRSLAMTLVGSSVVVDAERDPGGNGERGPEHHR